MSLLLCILLSSCTREVNKTTNSLSKEGIQPYKLTASDTELLQSLNLQDKANIFEFKAPKSARNLELNIYILNKNSRWEERDYGKVSLDISDSRILEGTFSMLLNENYSIDFNINAMGKASYKTDKIDLESKIISSSRVFLSQYMEIKLNQKIPVAILVYDSGNTIETYSTDDYFNPHKFQGKDLVQAVVLSFTDNNS
jgi:hypothetical protein